MIDPFKLATLPRDKPLRIFERASGFICVIRGCPQDAFAYRVKLPDGAGTACPNCAADSGWTVR